MEWFKWLESLCMREDTSTGYTQHKRKVIESEDALGAVKEVMFGPKSYFLPHKMNNGSGNRFESMA